MLLDVQELDEWMWNSERDDRGVDGMDTAHQTERSRVATDIRYHHV